MNILRPIGVSGIASISEAERVQTACENLVLAPEQAPTVPLFYGGVLVSSATLDGRPNPKPHRYPPLDRLEELLAFRADEIDTKMVCHYCSEDNSRVLADYKRIRQVIGGDVPALQLNLIWPDPEVIQSLRCLLGDGIKLILQVGKEALDRHTRDSEGHMVGYHEDNLFAHILKYEDAVDTILLDPSRGRGVDIIPHHLAPVMNLLSTTDFNVMVAGNLSGDTLPGLSPLMKAHPCFGIDTESAVRTEDDLEISQPRVEAYYKAAQTLFYAS